MIKLYQYGYGEINEIEAEGETDHFWIIKGRESAKTSDQYPDFCWYRSAEEAIRMRIAILAKKRDHYAEEIDKASTVLADLKKGT